MKSIRDQAKSAMSAKLHRLGAQGSLKQADKAESSHGSDAKCYATGGAVAVEGGPPKGNLGKPSRGKSAKGKTGKGTNVNVIIMGKGGAGPEMGPPPGGPGPMAGPPPDMGPPPGAGGPPMPMRAKGGRVNSDAAEDKKMVAKMIHKHEENDHNGSKMTPFKKGGEVSLKKDGAGSGLGRLAKVKAYGK